MKDFCWGLFIIVFWIAVIILSVFTLALLIAEGWHGA